MAQTSSPSPVDVNVSAAIEVARRLRKKRPEELAVAAGIGRASYYNRIAGRTRWYLDEVTHIAAALEIPLETLTAGPDAVLGLLTWPNCEVPWSEHISGVGVLPVRDVIRTVRDWAPAQPLELSAA